MIGSVLAFITKANFITPSYYITLLWQGGSAKEIWEGATGHMAQGWWYLSHLANGDALVAFGISLGVFSIIPALLGFVIVLFKGKNRLYGSLALIAAIIVIISLLGLTPLPS